MAGGKETPRQKMIGMMYLVLTALLALNVSKSVLDAFVEIEEGTQKSNIIQAERGNEFYADVRAELNAVSVEENELKHNKLKYVLAKMDEINSLSSNAIKHIDKLKINILESCGEDLSSVENGNRDHILWSAATVSDKNSNLPVRFNLFAVQGMDQYDIPMQVMLGTDAGGTIKNVKGEGEILWKEYLNYRSKLIESVGTYDWNGESYSVKAPLYNDFDSNKKLRDDVEKAFLAQKINKNDDLDFLREIYIELTKLEFSEANDTKDVHFMGRKFDHTPLVAAIATLSSLEQDILSSRTKALKHWKSKVSTGDYSFNQIMPLAYGPSVVNQGDSVDVNVMMVAYDSENQPKVKLNSEGNYEIFYPQDGSGKVRMVASGNTISLAGTVEIQNKSGETKMKDWSYSIPVMQPNGAIEIPAYNLLYKRYDNKIEISAAGYESAKLIADGATVSGSGPYIVRPLNGRQTVTLKVMGVNSSTNESKILKTIQYKVSSIPKPDLYWGNVPEGGRIQATETRLFVKLPTSSPLNATFEILSWTIRVNGGLSKSGSGNNVSSARNMIRSARPNDIITVEAVIKRGNVRSKLNGSFKK